MSFVNDERLATNMPNRAKSKAYLVNLRKKVLKDVVGGT